MCLQSRFFIELFWLEDTALILLLYNSNLKSQSLVWKHQIQFHNNSLVKLLNKNKSQWKHAAATVTRVENKFYFSIKTLWKYKAQSDWQWKSTYKCCLKTGYFPKLLMRCQCIVRVWVKTLQIKVKLYITMLIYIPSTMSKW